MTPYPVTVKANANGIAVAALPTRPPGQRWIVRQITISSTSVATTVAQVQLNNQVLCSSSAGNSDTAAGEPSIQVNPADTLSIVWGGCDVNATCVATFWQELAGQA